MLSPSSPSTPILLGAALIALVALLTIRAMRKDRREYQQFKRFRGTLKRQQMYRKWLVDSFRTFGGAGVVVLLLAWDQVPLLLADVNSIGWVDSARTAFAGSQVAIGVVTGILVALVGGMLLAIYAARHIDEVPAIGDIQALLPRNRTELRYGALLSINAGVVEELLFRLALPALIFGVTGNAAGALLGSLALFGALHVYQGAAGVIGSTIVGGLLMLVYLATGSILVAMAVHALIDLRSLVLIPVIVYKVHKKPVRRSPPAPPGSPDLSLPPM